MQNFENLGLKAEIAAALSSFGFAEPTPIQTLSIPVLLERHDAYISSATGTGKTFAFLAALLSTIDHNSAAIQALIIAPTHDLGAQLYRETEKLIQASGLPFKVAQAFGNIAMPRQMDRLARKPHVIVGSIGRIRDLATAGKINLGSCAWTVLDEADRLFEKEAIGLTSELLDALPAGCHRILVSATIPDRTIDRSARWFRSPVRLILDSTEALKTSIEHWCFHAASRSKLDFLRRFEAAARPERCLLFASSNATIFTITKKLEHLGFPAGVLKSDKQSEERRNVIADFAAGRIRWLITTDLGARGLDVPDISHVVSYDLPEEPTVYVHRAGRTGRAGQHGISICLADLVELKRASRIAVRYGFTFMCKILEAGSVHDIEPENFFALAEEEESARKHVRLEASRKPDNTNNRGRNTKPVGQFSAYAGGNKGSPPINPYPASRAPFRPADRFGGRLAANPPAKPPMRPPGQNAGARGPSTPDQPTQPAEHQGSSAGRSSWKRKRPLPRNDKGQQPTGDPGERRTTPIPASDQQSSAEGGGRSRSGRRRGPRKSDPAQKAD
jgi:superfamily II DNA/RNA helicase